MNTQTYGQVFTPPKIVKTMLALRQNSGSILEPSAGDGAFLRALENTALGIEIDPVHAAKDSRIQNLDFFQFPESRKFETILGNPPYVRYQDICPATKDLLEMTGFDRRTNLYLFFIRKCLDHLTENGEIIFITPRDFLKSTNARKLNEILYQQGSFTYFQDLGDQQVFKGYTPNCAIWRWQKGKNSRNIQDGTTFHCQNGQIWFDTQQTSSTLKDYFDVRVGAVSGADYIFRHRGNLQMVCSRTATDHKAPYVIYNRKHPYLNQFKNSLLQRRIRRFDESNWWHWGRKYPHIEGPRIYVNCKTRNPEPFYVSDIPAFDGSVLALFPKNGIDLSKATRTLNQVDWRSLGFVCGNRYLFTQRSLENAPVGV